MVYSAIEDMAQCRYSKYQISRCFLLFGVFGFAFQSIVCGANSRNERQVDAEELLGELKRFEQQFWGSSCQFWIKNGQVKRYATHWLAQSQDGVFVRSGLESEITVGDTIQKNAAEIVCVPGQRIAALRNGSSELPPLDNLRGYVDYDRRSIGISSTFFGFSRFDGYRFSEVFAKHPDRISVSGRRLDGQAVDVLEFGGPGLGRYEFYFSKSIPREVKKIVVSKSADDQMWDPLANKSVKLSDPLENVDGFATLDSETWFPIRYGNKNGKSIVESAKCVREIHHDAGETVLSLEFLLEEVTDFSVRDSSRAEFERMPVEEGMVVYVKGVDGLAFVYRDGRIERAYDTAGIKAIDGVRFREPESNWGWYTGLMIALCLVAGIWVYTKRRQNA